MSHVKYCGRYAIFSNGNILDLDRDHFIDYQKSGYVYLIRNGDKLATLRERFLYSVYHGIKLMQKDIVHFRNKNRYDYSFDNLVCDTRKPKVDHIAICNEMRSFTNDLNAELTFGEYNYQEQKYIHPELDVYLELDHSLINLL